MGVGAAWGIGGGGRYTGQKPNLMRLKNILLLKMEMGCGPIWGDCTHITQEWSLVPPVTGSLRTIPSLTSGLSFPVNHKLFVKSLRRCLSRLVAVIGSPGCCITSSSKMYTAEVKDWTLRLAEATLTGPRAPDSEAETSAETLLEVVSDHWNNVQATTLPWGVARSCQERPFSS